MSYVVAGYVAVLGGLGIYAARLVLRAREAASRIAQHGGHTAADEKDPR